MGLPSPAHGCWPVGVRWPASSMRIGCWVVNDQLRTSTVDISCAPVPTIFQVGYSKSLLLWPGPGITLAGVRSRTAILCLVEGASRTSTNYPGTCRYPLMLSGTSCAKGRGEEPPTRVRCGFIRCQAKRCDKFVAHLAQRNQSSFKLASHEVHPMVKHCVTAFHSI